MAHPASLQAHHAAPAADWRMVPMAEPTKEELLARVAELEKQVAVKKAAKLDFRVSEKGGVSVYGLGRSR